MLLKCTIHHDLGGVTNNLPNSVKSHLKSITTKTLNSRIVSIVMTHDLIRTCNGRSHETEHRHKCKGDESLQQV